MPNELKAVAARLSTVMKKLTGWAAIIAVPTSVTGWFGQNVAYAPVRPALGPDRQHRGDHSPSQRPFM